MKMILKTLAAAVMLAALTFGQTTAMDLPAPMPEFRSPQELQAEAASRAAVAQRVTSERAQIDTFYTGKPEDRESGTHIFLFRNYDPELSRWTANDPSGFPDGPNAHAYTSRPNLALDPNGLAIIDYSTQIVSISAMLPYTGYTVNQVRPTVTSSFSLGSVQQAGSCYFLSATQGYSFSGASERYLPQVGSTGGGGTVDSQFHADMFVHETWHQDIYVAYIGSVYEALEAWSGSYVSSRFSTASAAASAANADLTNALEVTARSFESLYAAMQDTHPSPGAHVVGGTWTAINPNWGADAFQVVVNFSPQFITTPGSGLCE